MLSPTEKRVMRGENTTISKAPAMAEIKRSVRNTLVICASTALSSSKLACDTSLTTDMWTPSVTIC